MMASAAQTGEIRRNNPYAACVLCCQHGANSNMSAITIPIALFPTNDHWNVGEELHRLDRRFNVHFLNLHSAAVPSPEEIKYIIWRVSEFFGVKILHYRKDREQYATKTNTFSLSIHVDDEAVFDDYTKFQRRMGQGSRVRIVKPSAEDASGTPVRDWQFSVRFGHYCQSGAKRQRPEDEVDNTVDPQVEDDDSDGSTPKRARHMRPTEEVPVGVGVQESTGQHSDVTVPHHEPHDVHALPHCLDIEEHVSELNDNTPTITIPLLNIDECDVASTPVHPMQTEGDINAGLQPHRQSVKRRRRRYPVRGSSGKKAKTDHVQQVRDSEQH